MELPTLYKKTKTGAVQEWQCQVIDNQIHIKYGQVGGIQTPTTKTCYGKNKGKANETSDHGQAIQEATSLWTKKKDRERYCQDIDGCDEIKIAPMLAQDINKNWKAVDNQFMQGKAVYISPKLDGNRLMVHAFYDEGEIQLEYYSRKLVKIDTLHHLDNQIIEYIKESGWSLPLHLDGEAYIHGVSLQTLNSFLKRLQPETDQIKYRVYDVYLDNSPEITFSERFKTSILGNYTEISESAKSVVPLDSYICESKEQIDSSLAIFEELGYEGAMIRLDKEYEPGARSKYLLKYKRFEDAEYRIVGYSYGKDRYEGCVIWKCITENNVEFDILAQGTLEEKKVNNPDNCIGKYVTIKYKDKTEEGIPKFGVIKCFKENF